MAEHSCTMQQSFLVKTRALEGNAAKGAVRELIGDQEAVREGNADQLAGAKVSCFTTSSDGHILF